MGVKVFAGVFTINAAFLYFGLRPIPMEQLAIMALAFSVLTIGGMKMVKMA